MENEIIKVSDRVVNRINKDEYGQISAEISDQTAEQIIIGLCNVAGRVGEQAFNAVAQIYTDALMRQEYLEDQTIQSQAERLRRFNDQVDKAQSQLDLKDDQTVANFEKVCATLRANIEVQDKNMYKPSLLQRLFSKNRE